LVEAFGGSIKYVYEKVLNGAALNLPHEKAIFGVSHSPHVKTIDQDGVVYAVGDVQAESWGLDRINHCSLPLDGIATKIDGSGVKVCTHVFSFSM
jgi:hypothetical protein